MSRVIPLIINAFTGGEFSRRMDGRTDHAKYYSGCRVLRNFIPLAQGAITRRPGFRFAAEVKDSSRKTALAPFNFDDSTYQSYMLELSHQVMRFFYQGGLIASGGSPLEIATPWTEDMVQDVRSAQRADIMYHVHRSATARKLVRSEHASWQLNEVEFQDGPWKVREPGDSDIVITPSAREGNGVTLTATSALFEAGHVGMAIRLGYVDPADSEAIQWGWAVITGYTSPTQVTCNIKEPFGAQYLADPSFDTSIAGWSDKGGNTAVSYIEYDAANKRMNLVQGASSTAIGESSGSVTAGVQLALEITVDAVPHQLRAYAGTATGSTNVLVVQTITATGKTTLYLTPTTDTLYVTLDTSGATSGDVVRLGAVSLTKKDLSTNEWRLQAFNAVDGHPDDVNFHEQRLVLAKGTNYYLSRTDRQFEEHGWSTPALDSDAISFEIVLDKVTAHHSMVSSDGLLVMTNAAEVRVRSGTEGSPLTPKERILPVPQSSYGSSDVPAVLAGSRVIFVSPSGKVVLDMGYLQAYEKFKARDITALAEHITGPGVVAMAFAREPTPVLWCALGDGSLVSCTYMPDEQVIAWCAHPLGGGGKVESLAVIPGDGYDQLWAVVRRIVGGQVKRYVEYLDPTFDGTGQKDARHAFFLDSGLSVNRWNTDAAKTMTLAADTAGAWAANNTGTLTAAGHAPFVAGDVGKRFFLADADGNETRVQVTSYTSASQVAVSFVWPIPPGLQAVATADWASTANTATGLGHLEGETVDVMADGSYLGQFVVTGGVVALGRYAAIVHVGLAYTSLVTPMRLEVPGQGSVLQSRATSIPRATVRVIDGVGGQVCADEDGASAYEAISVWGPAPLAGQAPPLFSGDKEVNLSSDADKKGLITVRQATPMPLTVTCIIPTVVAS